MDVDSVPPDLAKRFSDLSDELDDLLVAEHSSTVMMQPNQFEDATSRYIRSHFAD